CQAALFFWQGAVSRLHRTPLVPTPAIPCSNAGDTAPRHRKPARMDTTDNLGLPYIAAAQAQKHVTHNEALRTLDALAQLTVLDKDLAAPPASPAAGQRYIVAAAASGAWAGQDGSVAAWQDGAWAFHMP